MCRQNETVYQELRKPLQRHIIDIRCFAFLPLFFLCVFLVDPDFRQPYRARNR